jgi:DnaJ-class molecular chaperone
VRLCHPAAPRGYPMKKPAKKKEKCKNCEGKGLLKNGDKVVRCKRCNGTGFKP